MNLKCAFHLQIEILLKAEQTLNWKFFLPQGINYSCSFAEFFFFSFFFSWLVDPDRQAQLCKAFLVFSAFLWLLWELCLSEDCRIEPGLLKNCINPISNISKSLKGKLE